MPYQKHFSYHTNIQNIIQIFFIQTFFYPKKSQSRYQIRLFGENGNTGVILTRKTQ